jgi:hypothetical protein
MARTSFRVPRSAAWALRWLLILPWMVLVELSVGDGLQLYHRVGWLTRILLPLTLVAAISAVWMVRAGSPRRRRHADSAEQMPSHNTAHDVAHLGMNIRRTVACHKASLCGVAVIAVLTSMLTNTDPIPVRIVLIAAGAVTLISLAIVHVVSAIGFARALWMLGGPTPPIRRLRGHLLRAVWWFLVSALVSAQIILTILFSPF